MKIKTEKTTKLNAISQQQGCWWKKKNKMIISFCWRIKESYMFWGWRPPPTPVGLWTQGGAGNFRQNLYTLAPPWTDKEPLALLCLLGRFPCAHLCALSFCFARFSMLSMPMRSYVLILWAGLSHFTTCTHATPAPTILIPISNYSRHP